MQWSHNRNCREIGWYCCCFEYDAGIVVTLFRGIQIHTRSCDLNCVSGDSPISDKTENRTGFNWKFVMVFSVTKRLCSYELKNSWMLHAPSVSSASSLVLLIFPSKSPTLTIYRPKLLLFFFLIFAKCNVQFSLPGRMIGILCRHSTFLLSLFLEFKPFETFQWIAWSPVFVWRERFTHRIEHRWLFDIVSEFIAEPNW